jgi:ABC-type uncharacterized transport system substrate-binding protein
MRYGDLSRLTGVNILANELDAKRLEILHEAVPFAKRIGALALPNAFDSRSELDEAAQHLALELVVISVRKLDELTAGLAALQSAMRKLPERSYVAERLRLQRRAESPPLRC